ncbi:MULTISPECIES: FkbM family methyltransferase [unclassified Brevundimonas]|nr:MULTISPECIES: FkbM family methyltransferase [unclassified Brevundimonas]MCK6104968.1 FkbM family methyltransferase [Brevundimonas sp. EYE_349]
MRLHPCGNFFLSFPDDHKLPEIHRSHALYDRSYSWIIKSLSDWKPNAAIIDIGANVGDTAAYIRTHAANPIVCVEGGQNFLDHLHHNAKIIDSDHIHIVDRFVSPNNSTSLSASFIEDRGTGRLVFDDGQELQSITTSNLLRYARNIGDGDIALVKTDTDGMDALIVRDLLDSGPDFAIHFECDYILTRSLGRPDLWTSILQDLKDRDWSSIVFDNYGLPMMFMDKTQPEILENVQAWIHLQHQVGMVRTHYVDIFSFPPDASHVYNQAKNSISSTLLFPYRY